MAAIGTDFSSNSTGSDSIANDPYSQDPTGTGTYASSPTDSSSSSSGGLFSGLSNGLQGLTGLTPQQMAALASAGVLYKDSGELSTEAQNNAGFLDPAANFQQGYGEQLQALEKDPSSIANTPGYQFALQQGLGAVDRGDAKSKGGAVNADDISFASGLAQQTYNSQISQLTQLSGANFSPQSAASMLQTGMMASMGMKTAAMNNMFGGVFAPGNTVNNNLNNNTPNGPPTPPPGYNVNGPGSGMPGFGPSGGQAPGTPVMGPGGTGPGTDPFGPAPGQNPGFTDPGTGLPINATPGGPNDPGTYVPGVTDPWLQPGGDSLTGY